MHEDEYEDDKPLVRPASRKEPAEKRRYPATDDEDIRPLVPPRQPSAAPVREKKRTSSVAGPRCNTGTGCVKGLARASRGYIDFWAERQKVMPYATS